LSPTENLMSRKVSVGGLRPAQGSKPAPCTHTDTRTHTHTHTHTHTFAQAEDAAGADLLGELELQRHELLQRVELQPPGQLGRRIGLAGRHVPVGTHGDLVHIHLELRVLHRRPDAKPESAEVEV
jgi:hypothetical protein